MALQRVCILRNLKFVVESTFSFLFVIFYLVNIKDKVTYDPIIKI